MSYNGIRVTVPASWPVVNVNLQPSTCVRLDQTAVYLGSPGPNPNCPAHALGRANTIWLTTQTSAQETPATAATTSVGALAARVSLDPAGNDKQVQFAGKPVTVQASWGANSSTVDHVLASAVSSGTSTPAPASAAAPAPPLAATAPQIIRAGAVSTGYGFDTCAAPSTSTMSAWLSSPYRSVGVYIGGSMRACGDGNLSARWVAQVYAMGWHLIPIYVGPQAPTVNQGGLATISPSQAYNQGISNAADAVARARYFGMGAGTPVYYDMENYNPGGSSSVAVMTFLQGWTAEVHALGYKSGTYGGPGAVMTDLSRYVAAHAITPPDDVWFAQWNGVRSTTDQWAYPGFPDSYWSFHQRLHQYAGGATYYYGGAGVNIDADWVDGAVAGTSTPAAPPSNPFGQIDAVSTARGNVSASGWAIDPNTGSPIMVQMYVDYRTNALTWASRARPDVGTAYPTYGPNHGYTLTMAATPGAHTVCLYAINTGPGASTGLGCRVVNVSSNPFGQIDAVSTASGKVSASGWAIDPNTGSPIMVKMYVDYRTNALTWASRARPDVGTAYPTYGPNHGYTLTMAATPGAHTVCLYAINTGPGVSTGLGCRVVNVSSSPFGQIDAVSTASGKVSASGWAIDPNTGSPIMVQMYVDYRTNALTWASRARPDVGTAYPTYGPNHGYTLTMAATPGAHTVCLYAINTGPGASTGLGCRIVNVP